MPESKQVEVRILDLPYQADKAYTYLCDLDNIDKGCFVLVPFGRANKPKIALVTNIKNDTQNFELKSVLCKVCEEMSLSEKELELVYHTCDRTFCSTGDAVKRIIPSAAFDTASEILVYKNGDETNLSKKELDILNIIKDGPINTSKLVTSIGNDVTSIINSLIKKGLVDTNVVVKKNEGATNEIAYINDEGDELELARPRTPEAYKEIYTIIMEHDGFPVRELEDLGFKRAHIKALEKRGLINLVKREVIRNHYDTFEATGSLPQLSEEQDNAYRELDELAKDEKAKAALLYGVTGSGKTSVMLTLCKSVIDSGKKAIVLVPEIGLTWQAVSTFATIFGKRLAIIHSGLSDGERYDSYKRIIRDEVDIVLGTRSAVFAPLKNIGLIVIDEEQEHTYKSEMAPRYNAKDIASFRISQTGGLLLLCSATPSVETFYKAQTGKISLVKLTKRYGKAVLPDVIISDMRQEDDKEINGYLGQTLTDELVKNKETDHQSVLLLNRRGFNSYVICRTCGQTITCPKCTITMTNHKLKFGKYLICHYCGSRMRSPSICPNCTSTHLMYGGFGTQRVEDEIKEKINGAVTSRMDADSTKGKFTQDNLVESFSKGESDILIGTQMIAKGHNFPKVTLVGVVDADSSLYSSDFRASEKTFSLLTQVIGRAGRGDEKGRAIIQTMNPYNSTIKLAAKQDYEKFYENEIKVREALCFPPFCDLTIVSFTSVYELKAERLAGEFLTALVHESHGEFSDLKLYVYGPFDANIYKLNNRFRKRIVIKHKNTKRYRDMMSKLIILLSKNKSDDTTFTVDIDPIST
ncbi:MAG: primosomal protein N' [Clostridia bacterium]|nr:primosomal protein N' [Clostridia bacterium]